MAEAPYRNERDRICLIVNPRSGGGATGKRLEAIEAAAKRWFSKYEIRLTERSNHATAIAAEVAGHFDIVAAVGGDGTANEVVNGLMDGERARNPDVRFTVVPGGTGSDLIRSLQIPNDLERGMAIAANGVDRACDLVAVRYTDPSGVEGRRLCANVTGFGVNGDVVRLANQSSKRFGGSLTFFGATIQALLAFTPPEVELTWRGPDGEGRFEGKMLVGFIGNGHYCGGGMWIGPQGSMSDGAAELVLVPQMPAFDIARSLPRLYDGHIDRAPGVRRARIHQLSARVLDGRRVTLDIDGESPGVLPSSYQVLPSVLQFRAASAIA